MWLVGVHSLTVVGISRAFGFPPAVGISDLKPDPPGVLNMEWPMIARDV